MMKASPQKQAAGPRASCPEAGSTLFHPGGLKPASPAQSPPWEWQADLKLSPPHDFLKPPTSGLRLPSAPQRPPLLTGHPPHPPGQALDSWFISS